MSRSPAGRREINCDFFRVHIGKNRNIIQVFDDYHSRVKVVSDRNVQIEDVFLRVHGWTNHGQGVASGAFIRLRTDNLASIGSLDREHLEDIQLLPNQALAEYACFRYFAEFNVIVVQRNRNAGTIRRLEYYLEEACGCRPTEFGIVETIDAWRRLESLDSLTVAEVAIEIPENLSAYNTDGAALEQMVRYSSESGVTVMSVKLSAGRSRKPLSRRIIDMLRRFASEFEGSVTKATLHGPMVAGSLADRGMLDTIDLVSDKMTAKVFVSFSGANISVSDIQVGLQQAYDLRREELVAQFSS